jgi:hypothetical protein
VKVDWCPSSKGSSLLLTLTRSGEVQLWKQVGQLVLHFVECILIVC